MANRIAGITVEIGGDTTKLSSALKSINSEIKSTQTQLKDVEKLLKLDPSNTELLTQKQKLLTSAISDTKDKLTTLKTAAEQANEQLQNGDITQEQYDALQREIIATEQELEKLADEAAEANTALNKISEVGSTLEDIGDKITDVGTSLTTKVTAPIVALGTAAVATAADFESSMSQVQATMGITSDATSELNGQTVNTMDALSDLAKEMGSTTAFSASECAEALNYLALAGYDTQEMADTLPVVLNLAAAGSIDLADASDMVTDAMSALGMGTDEASTMVDQMAKTASTTNTSVDQLGEGILKIGATAKSMAGGTAELNTALGILANNGIKGAEGGTHLRNVILALQSPTDTAASCMEDLGLQVYDSEGNMRSLNDILGDLNASMDGLTSEEKNNIISTIFNKTDLASVNALLANTGDTWDELQSSIIDSGDAAQQMADTQLDNLSGQLTILKSALEGLAIAFGETLMPAIKAIVEKIQGFVDKLNSMDESQRKVVVTIAAVAAAIGPLLVIIGTLIGAVGKAMTNFSNLGTSILKVVNHMETGTGMAGKLVTALGGISAPVVAVVAVIGTLVAAFATLWNTNEEFRTAITEIWSSIKETVSVFIDGIKERFEALGISFEGMGGIVETLKNVWMEFCNLLAPLFEGAFSAVATVLETVLDVITGLLDVFIGIFTGNWEQAWTGVKEIFGGIWDGIKGILSTVLETIKGMVDVVLGWFGTSWDECWSEIKSFFEGIWNGISSFFSGILTGIQTVATTVWTAISGFFTTVLTAIQTVFSTVWNAISTAVSTVMGTIQSVITTVWTAISTAVSTVITTIHDTIVNTWNAIYSVIEPLLTAFQYLFETIWQAIQILISNALMARNGFFITSFYQGKFYNAHMSPDVKVTLDGTEYYAGALFYDDNSSYIPTKYRGAYDNDGISDIAIPKVLHCMEGRQLSCYYDSLSRFEGSENLYRFTYSTTTAGTTITRNELCWNYTPGADATDFTMTAIRLNRVTAANQETKAITVKVNHPLTKSITKNVCICGDSLVDNKYLAQEVWDMLDEDGDCVINHIGTRGGTGYEHEGRGSWTWARYLKGEEYSGKTNAFWNTDDDCLDFQWYCKQNGYDGIDYMLIALGTNDVSQGSTAYSTFASLATIINNAKQFIDVLLSEDRGYPNCKVGIGLIGPGSDYSYLISSSMYTFRKSSNTLNQLYLETFDNGAYHENVTCFSHGMMTNRKYAYPYSDKAISDRYSETSRTLTNSIHPSARGYQAWADGYYNMIRGFLTEDAESE